MKRLPPLFFGILAMHVCARHESPRGVDGAAMVGWDSAPPAMRTANPPSDGGAPPPTLLAGRVAPLAFPELREQPGWKSQEKQGARGSGLWLVLVQRTVPRASEGPDSDAALEPWPDTRLAVMQEVNGVLKRMGTGEVSPDSLLCTTDTTAMNRRFDIEIDEKFVDIVPGQVFIPLRIACTLTWPAADSFEEHLLLWKSTGQGFAEVLNVLTEHTNYDHLTQRSTGRSLAVMPPLTKRGDRTRLCFEALSSEPHGMAARAAAGNRPPRQSECYEWDGARFRRH